MTSHYVEFEPIGLRGDCSAERSLLDCARQLGVELVCLCNGAGTCHGCRIQVMEGTISPLTTVEKEFFSTEELEQGYRLACQTYAKSDLKIRVPPISITAQQRTQVESKEVIITPDPPIISYQLDIAAPSLADLRADDQRLLDSLRKQHKVKGRLRIDDSVLRYMSPKLCSWKWQAQASLRDNEIIALNSTYTPTLGLAVDLGTTKIAAYLVDLETGETLAATGIMNPQISYGEDVITRIDKASKSAAETALLQNLVVTAINQIVIGLCNEINTQPENILEAVVVGNTAMHHLFLRLPVTQLSRAPYVPTVSKAIDIKAREVGLNIAPGYYVHLLPNIAGFVGADHVATLIATEPWKAGKYVLTVDIGTNTEVCLVSNNDMTSVSCASGPAFEGAYILQGMRAASGAIEHVRLVNGLVEYQTIQGTTPVGLCGSGVIDTVAQLYLNGVVDRSGRMTDKHPRVRHGKEGLEFVLVEERESGNGRAIVITQQDIRTTQLAKSAIHTGIKLLLEGKKCCEAEIEHVIIAGAFGTYIDISSAMTIGMLPELPLNRFQQVGNAAGTGARLALASCQKRREAQEIARRVKYIELAADQRFTLNFVEGTKIGNNTEGG